MMAMPGPWVVVHLGAALWVLLLGAVQLLWRKGTAGHRRLGWSWLLAMLLATLSSFGIRNPQAGSLGFSWIHLLSLWVLWCLFAGTLAIRKRHIRAHRAWLGGAYCGAVVAGIIAVLTPGRWLHQVLTSLSG